MKSQNAFTLIELLVVIVFIAMLMPTVMPAHGPKLSVGVPLAAKAEARLPSVNVTRFETAPAILVRVLPWGALPMPGLLVTPHLYWLWSPRVRRICLRRRNPPGQIKLMMVLTIVVFFFFSLGPWLIGQFRDWGVLTPDEPKTVVIAYQCRGRIETWLRQWAGVSLDSLARQLRRRGHTVLVLKPPDEENIIAALNRADYALMSGHTARSDTPGEELLDRHGARFGGVLLSGTRRLAEDVVTGSVSNRELWVPKRYITPLELAGKINNPRLTLIAPCCELASCDSMFTAINPRVMIAPRRRIGSEGIVAGAECLVDLLNNEDLERAVRKLRVKSPSYEIRYSSEANRN
jgi:hypothetical protein